MMKRCISDSVLHPGRPGLGPLPHGPHLDYMSSSFNGVQPFEDFSHQGMRPLPEYDHCHPAMMMGGNHPLPPPPASVKPMMSCQQPQALPDSTTPTRSNNWLYKQLNELTEKYRDAVYEVAKRYLDNMDEKDVYIMKKMFSEWKSERDKLDVNNMYKLPGWRAIYTKSLFLSRIQTVEFSIQRVLYIKAPKKILMTANQFVSLGCGPGPCIAAVLMVLRTELGVMHNIEFVGVDQFIGWKPYIDSLSMKDHKSTVSFKQMRVDETSLDDLPSGDVAIMSYTDASIHTPNFWEGMRKKYQLILILDQNKSKLHSLLVQQKFRPVEYMLKGRKRFYYQVSGIVSKNVLESKRSKGPPLVKISTDDESLDLAKPTDEDEEESAQCNHDTKSEPSDDDSDIIPISQMMELKAMEEIGPVITKTKCGTQSGRYSGALEPQKKMTPDRMNQLLKAKLIAMEESGVDVSLADTVSETSVDSPCISDIVTSETGDDMTEEFDVLESEEFKLLSSIDIQDDAGIITFDSFQPVLNGKRGGVSNDRGQSIPVITSNSSNKTKRPKFEFPSEFLDEFLDDDDSAMSAGDIIEANNLPDDRHFDLRDILKRKRQFSEISGDSTATAVRQPRQKIVPIKMECSLSVNRSRNIQPSIIASSVVSEQQRIPVLSSTKITAPSQPSQNHFKPPGRLSSGTIRHSQSYTNSTQSSLLATPTIRPIYANYSPYNALLPSPLTPLNVPTYNATTASHPISMSAYSGAVSPVSPYASYTPPANYYNAYCSTTASFSSHTSVAMSPAAVSMPRDDKKPKDLRQLLNSRRNQQY